MIKSFNEFNRIDESVLYYAPPFREQLEILKKSGSDIAYKLLELEMEDLPTDITFVNSAEDVGYLTFHPMAKAIEKIKKTYHTDEDEDGKDILDIQTNPNKKYHDNIYNNDLKDELNNNPKYKNILFIIFGRAVFISIFVFQTLLLKTS